MELPTDLVSAFKRGLGAVFLGAGASASAGLPDRQQVAGALARDLRLPRPDNGRGFPASELIKIPQYYENRYNRRRLVNRLQELMEVKRFADSEVHNLITQLPCDTYYTTNHDELLEETLRQQHQGFAAVVSEEAARTFAERRGKVVRKIHGTISQPDTLIVTRSDYADFASESRFSIDALRNDLTQRVFLFVGYSLTDPDFNSVYDHVLYGMGRMRQTHFICINGPTELEVQDLRQCGIEVIDLALWPGRTEAQRLISFLQALAEATSAMVHVERFFCGVRQGERVPMIVRSVLNEEETSVYYPDCDIRVAQEVEKALQAMGCEPELVPSVLAEARFDEYLQQNLVLICSPLGNSFTARVFDRLEERTTNICIRFRRMEDDRGYLEDIKTGLRYVPDRPGDADPQHIQYDYSVIARYRNPWADDKYLFIMAGLNAIGTHAVSRFLSNLMNYRKLPRSQDDSVLLLRVSYRAYDPYRFVSEEEPFAEL
ncbi:SIR2 family protein [Streptomyces collinus]|uniref:SIR2 family protein n=1 Tax=Streptomyces collinus TaxID=42684 RepID=UPI0036B9F3AA